MGQDPANPAYAQLFELSPFPAVVSRLDDHRVLAVNRSAVDVVGVRPADAVGQPVSGYYVNPAQRLELVERVRRDGRADNVRLHIRRANGTPFWVLASIRVIDWNGVPAALTVFHDISDQLAAESSLKASERRLAAQSDALTGLTARYTTPGERFDDGQEGRRRQEGRFVGERVEDLGGVRHCALAAWRARRDGAPGRPFYGAGPARLAPGQRTANSRDWTTLPSTITSTW